MPLLLASAVALVQPLLTRTISRPLVRVKATQTFCTALETHFSIATTALLILRDTAKKPNLAASMNDQNMLMTISSLHLFSFLTFFEACFGQSATLGRAGSRHLLFAQRGCEISGNVGPATANLTFGTLRPVVQRFTNPLLTHTDDHSYRGPELPGTPGSQLTICAAETPHGELPQVAVS